MRAGAHALSLLAVPMHVHVLRVLEEEPRPLANLRRAVGSPPQSTMRKHLRALTEVGVLERRRESDFPGAVDYELTRRGRELLGVAAAVQDWLSDAPDGPLTLGSVGARSAIKALVGGWEAQIVRAIAARPTSLTELNKLIQGVSYPTLERRLSAMRMTGLIEAAPGASRGTPYRASRWLRAGVAPLALAVRWERRHIPERSAPIGKLDVEAVFLLTVPALSLPAEASGTCRLAVEIRSGSGSGLAGVLVGIEEGRVVSCVSRLTGPATAWITGSAITWLDALIDRELGLLETGGDSDLAFALLDALERPLATFP